LRILVYFKHEHVLDVEQRERHAHDALLYLDASLDE